MQPGVKWMVHITVMSCCSNSCCQTSVKLLATFTFQCTTHVQEHWAATQDSGLHTRCMTSQHLSSVDYRLLRVIQECVYQKQQGTSNIVDELCLLTEWHFINRLTHHISQGRVVTPIKFTSVSVCQTLSQYNAVWQSYCKNRRVQFFFAPQCRMVWLPESEKSLRTRVAILTEYRHVTDGHLV